MLEQFKTTLLYGTYWTWAAIIESLRRILPEAILVSAVAILGHFLTGKLTEGVKRYMDAKARVDFEKEDYALWEQLTEGVGYPGRVLGVLERIVFFLALQYNFELFIGAWLVFKVAAKWQAWTTIVKIPQNDSSVSLQMRRLLGGLVMQSFLIGTLSNILVAGLGHIVADSLPS